MTCKKHHVLYHRFVDGIQIRVNVDLVVYEELENAKHLMIQCIAQNYSLDADTST